ncbi:MAG: toprim domain-containing protein, partial [Spirochaetia bacterium]|nr:toprim domain-containing protein [Spirochaetia bacterium]
KYLTERGVHSETIDLFALGFAPAGGDHTYRALRASGFSDEDIFQAGLTIKRDRGVGYFDRFRGRLMFPIRDVSGNVVAFGGRSLPGKDKEAKYLNSAESSIFRKGSVLFGLYEGIAHVRKEREVIIVEGYLDVIGMSQAGVKTAVAPLGTALTASHVRLLVRYVSDLRAVFDGDRAGRSAALKFARLVVDYEGVRGNVVLLPTGQDPFDVSVNFPESRIREVLACSISAGQYLLMETLYPEITQARILKHSTRDPYEFASEMARFYADPAADLPTGVDHKRSARARLFELVRSLKQSSERELFVREGARLLRLDPDNLMREFEAGAQSDSGSDFPANRGAVPVRSGPSGGVIRPSGAMRSARPEDPLVKSERELIADFFVAPTAVASCRGAMADFEFLDSHSEIAWRYLETKYLTGDIWTPDSIPTFELPPETLSVFTGLVIHRAENADDDSRESLLEIVTAQTRAALGEIIILENHLYLRPPFMGLVTNG